MGEHHIDVLADRVERLRERTEWLQGEFDSVRRRTRHLEDRETDTRNRQMDVTDGRPTSGRTGTERGGPTDDIRSTDPDTNGASDEEVKAAVRRVETDSGDETEDCDREEIIVA